MAAFSLCCSCCRARDVYAGSCSPCPVLLGPPGAGAAAPGGGGRESAGSGPATGVGWAWPSAGRAAGSLSAVSARCRSEPLPSSSPVSASCARSTVGSTAPAWSAALRCRRPPPPPPPPAGCMPPGGTLVRLPAPVQFDFMSPGTGLAARGAPQSVVARHRMPGAMRVFRPLRVGPAHQLGWTIGNSSLCPSPSWQAFMCCRGVLRCCATSTWLPFKLVRTLVGRPDDSFVTTLGCDHLLDIHCS